MKKSAFIFAIGFLSLLFIVPAAFGQKMAIFNFPVEIELTNDQGDMPTKDYLKNYGTKGKKRGIEYIYNTCIPFISIQFQKHGKELLAIDTLSSIKANEYGHPAAAINKVVTTGIADQYIRFHLKDIGMVALNGENQSDPYNRQKMLVKIRCRIQIYDKDKNMVKEAVGEFQTGDKIENAAELGVDLRRNTGTEYEQE